MKQWIFVFLAVCAGCSAGGSSDGMGDAVYSYSEDQYSDTGLVLKAYEPGAVSYIPFEEMEAIYVDVEACVVNTATPGPYLEFISFKHRGLGGGWGVYAAANLTAYINADEDGIAPRNKWSDRGTVRHEFVHHILYMNGQDWSHANEAFARCEALGTKTCNGVPCEG